MEKKLEAEDNWFQKETTVLYASKDPPTANIFSSHSLYNNMVG